MPCSVSPADMQPAKFAIGRPHMPMHGELHKTRAHRPSTFTALPDGRARSPSAWPRGFWDRGRSTDRLAADGGRSRAPPPSRLRPTGCAVFPPTDEGNPMSSTGWLCAAASVMSGGTSVTMIATSIAMTEPRLQDGPHPRQVCGMGRRRRWLREIEIILCQRDHEIGVVMRPNSPISSNFPTCPAACRMAKQSKRPSPTA